MNRVQVLQEHMKLVVWCAKRFGPHRMSLEDRVQEASLEAWLKLAKYDPERDIALSTFLSTVVRNRMYKLCRDSLREVPTVTTEGISESHVGYSTEAVVLRFIARREIRRAASGYTRQRNRKGNTFQPTDVMEMLFSGLTQSAIARKLGVSRERIRQIVAEVRARRSA